MKNQKEEAGKLNRTEKSKNLIELRLNELMQVRGGTGQGSWDDR